VTVQEEGFDPEIFHLVGATEADPRKGKISHESPIGNALMGHQIDDIVQVDTPDGILKLKILKID
jgi:transcription elongation factor GreA